MKPEYTYLLLNIGTILFPFLLSFDKKVAFFKNWKSLFPAIAVAGGIFIVWDVWFTDMGIWNFNPEYLTGIYLVNLPLEEWLFFLTVPYACVFIYACLNAYVPRDLLGSSAKAIGWGLVAVLLLIGFLNLDKWYTAVTFLGLSAWLIGLLVWIKPAWLGRFFLSYLVSLIPFFLVNGVLTALPVVRYNDLENLAIRLYTIPVEDTMYGLLLLLMTVSIFEWLQSRFFSVSSVTSQLSHSPSA